ncbi:universal stress protein [Chelativorans sp.]|uniref:universal stress protein n=1 Tax=Chelativorans sp. TaxID=2203393 RepID=UPI002811EB03|nr:universal stress protein [Chelativorans sp.]
MTYKTMLAILQSRADAPRVLDFALPLAARFGSHLIGLHAEVLPIAIASPMGMPTADFTLAMQEDAKRRHEELRGLFTERASAEGVMQEWRGFENLTGDSAISGIESARTADLVIVQQNDPNADSRRTADVEALLFHSGRPVLFVPYAFPGRSEPVRQVLLAWKGSKEAARAAFDALPLMKEAGRVEILTVDAKDTLEQDAGLAGTAMAAALARHGIDVTTRAEQSAGASQAEAITNRMAAIGADLLVMGAFGRSRLAEWVFGGVTRDMLRTMTTPTFMSR